MGTVEIVELLFQPYPCFITSCDPTLMRSSLPILFMSSINCVVLQKKKKQFLAAYSIKVEVVSDSFEVGELDDVQRRISVYQFVRF